MVRQLAVIETPVGISQEHYQQLLLLTPAEAQAVRERHPELTVRWAEQEDRKQWALSQAIFTDPRGIATRDMVVLPDEVKDRFKLAKKRR